MNYTQHYPAIGHRQTNSAALPAQNASNTTDSAEKALYEPFTYCTLPDSVTNAPRINAKGPSWILGLIALVIFIGGLMEIESAKVQVTGADSLKCPLLAVNDSGSGLRFEQHCSWTSGTVSQ